MSQTNLFMDCKIVCDMRNCIMKGWSYQDWTTRNQGKVSITLAKSMSLWDKARKGLDDGNWNEYMLKMAAKFTKQFVAEMELLESEGCDGSELTEMITTTLSECWG